MVFSSGADVAGLSDFLSLLQSKCSTARSNGLQLAKALNCLRLMSSDKRSDSSLTAEPCGVFDFSEQCRLSAT